MQVPKDTVVDVLLYGCHDRMSMFELFEHNLNEREL